MAEAAEPTMDCNLPELLAQDLESTAVGTAGVTSAATCQPNQSDPVVTRAVFTPATEDTGTCR